MLFSEMIIETAWKWHSTHPNGYADWHWNPAGSLLDFYFVVIFSCNLFISAIIWKTLTFMLQLREQIKYIEVISWLLVIMDNGKKQDLKNWRCWSWLSCSSWQLEQSLLPLSAQSFNPNASGRFFRLEKENRKNEYVFRHS